jgi:hypothetical protein
MCRFGKIKGPAYSCTGKKHFPSAVTPGPTFADQYPYATKRNYGKFSLGIQLKSVPDVASPGPVYLIPGAMGPKIPDLKANPAYSFGTVHVGGKRDVMPGAGHYPATTLNAFKKKQPVAVITGRHKGLSSKVTPGPSSYLPKYNGPNPPKYSFGVRHNPCMGPHITPLDRMQ